MNTKVKKALALINDVEKAIRNWNERSQFKLKGVGNLSRLDMDTLTLYAQTLVNNNGEGFGNFIEPRGEVAEVFKKYGLID